jgi:D-3-phosphoglycerate dehydrogenase
MALARAWTQIRFHPDALAELADVAEVQTGTFEESDAWFSEAANYDAMLVNGLLYCDGPFMDRVGSRLRVIARPGIGYDRVDTVAATERGIMVINTPDGPTESTAEHAIALMLSLTKTVVSTDRILRSGAGFPVYGTLPQGLETLDATLGLVGLGRIGGRVAEIARVLGMRVLAYDPFTSPERAEALGVTLAPSLESVLSQSQVVSIHCPYMPSTHQLINAERLASMPKGSYLINVARGPIVDEAALYEALSSGHLAGAGLDVFDPEPPDPANPLFQLPNIVCTPHIASYTTASVKRMQVMACQQVAMALRGEQPTSLVNREVWESRRGA